jgi:hypothetical protein
MATDALWFRYSHIWIKDVPGSTSFYAPPPPPAGAELVAIGVAMWEELNEFMGEIESRLLDQVER